MRTRFADGCGVVALIVWAAGGCATSEGDARMRRGAYEEAAAAYDADLQATPGDPVLARKRDAAREAALRAKLEQARAVRASGHGEAALSLLDAELRLESRWSLVPEGEVKAVRDGEIAGAGETVGAAVRKELSAGAPLAARARAAALAPLLAPPQLHPIAEKAQADIAAAGKTRCDELAAREAGGKSGEAPGRAPYLARLLVDYCARVGGTFAAPAPPEQSRGLRVSGRLTNMSEAQHQIVEAWLADVFRSSPWFAADGAGLSPLELAGRYDARLERRRVALSVPYRTVTRSVVTEGLIGLGPSATVETESERVFEYEAEQYDARYGLDATLTLDLGAGPPLVVTISHAEKKRALEHDVRFPQANVYPQKANLPDVNTWLSTFLGTKRTAMLRKLRGRWSKAYCGAASFSPETAARCLQSGQRQPAAEKALAAFFGGDTQAVVETLTRPRADERSPAEAKALGVPAVPAKPEIQETPKPGVGEAI